ncbi:MAG: hypothetical protein HY234_02365 [Acidobacteria bacterium]|nr:hypothetical protein [Acidobacteriota bacterium]
MRIITLAAAAACLCGCTPYSFSGGKTALVSSIAVPLFENQTTEFGLPETLTRGIINGFVQDNQVKIDNASAAEAVLSGRIVDYKRKAYTFDENDHVSEYIVEIWVSADLTRKTGSQAVWTVDRLRGFGTYKADSENEHQGQERAIAKITEDLLNRTIKSW